MTSLRPSVDFGTQPILHALLSNTVANFIDVIRIWNWYLFSHLWPSNTLLKIFLIHLPTISHYTDNCFWGVSFNGMFSVRFAYDFWDDSIGSRTHNFWRLAWS